MRVVAGQLVVVVSESVGGSFFVEARYYESDSPDVRIRVADRTLVRDTGLEGFAGCIDALKAL